MKAEIKEKKKEQDLSEDGLPDDIFQVGVLVTCCPSIGLQVCFDASF